MPSLAKHRRAELEAALAALAVGCTTAGDVAERLVAADCKGNRRDFCECPVAVWLHTKLPGPHLTITVGPDDVEAQWESEETYADITELPVYDVSVSADLPRVVAAFIEALDDRALFPELDRAPTDSEYYEVYPTVGSCALNRDYHGRLRHDDAYEKARIGSSHGPAHCIDRVTTTGGQRRRNRVAEYRSGELIF